MTENPYSQTWMRQDASLLVVFVPMKMNKVLTNYPTPDSFY